MGLFDRLFGKKKQQPSQNIGEPSLSPGMGRSQAPTRATATPAPSASRSPLLSFDPLAQVRKQENQRGLRYGSAGVESYHRLSKALQSVPTLDAGDPRLPQKRKQCSFAEMIDEVDFFLGQSVAQGSVVTSEVRHGVFVKTSVGYEIAKVNDDCYLLWHGPHEPGAQPVAGAEKPPAPPAAPTVLSGPLFQAAARGDLSTVKEMLEKGAPVDDQTDGTTPLQAAAWHGHADAVQCLLAAGANVNATDAQGWTPLHYGAKGHNSRVIPETSKLAVVRMLLAAGASVHAVSKPGKGLDGVNNPGVTPIQVAQGWDYAAIVALLKTGASGSGAPSAETAHISKGVAMTDREMVDKLIELARYYADGGLSSENPALVNEVMEIGRVLDRRGGITEMRRIFAKVPAMQGKRTVEMQWDGIGDWRG